MLYKLQRKTLVPVQIIGYLITLFIGVSILIATLQFFVDVRSLLSEQTDVFSKKSVIVSKQVSLFKTFNKDGVYFDAEEIEELRSQPFVEEVSTFTNAGFEVSAFTDKSGNVPMFYTDLFFESVPDAYLDVTTDDWKWEPDSDFIPIIIPENYLNLYNFGFAESQGLPVLSKNTITKIQFNIQIAGNGKRKVFKSNIVGFSDKINSILVPMDFLTWANANYSNTEKRKVSRLLVAFKDPSDKAILQFFNAHNYNINKQDLEFTKVIFFFKTGLLFVLLVAVIIIVLSVAFILMSKNLILQKNATTILNLYYIGYSPKQIGKFYQMLTAGVTFVAIVLALICCTLVRGYYLDKFSNMFEATNNPNYIVPIGVFILLVLVGLYYVLLARSIKKLVVPKS